MIAIILPLFPQDIQQLGILIESKNIAQKHDENSKLDLHLAKAAQEAIIQINHQAYITELQALGFQRVCKRSLAFHGKKLHMGYEIETLPPW